MEVNSESVPVGAKSSPPKVSENIVIPAKSESIDSKPIDHVSKPELKNSDNVKSHTSKVDYNAPISTTQYTFVHTPTKPVKVYSESPKKLEKQQKSLLNDTSSPRKEVTLPTKSNEVTKTLDPTHIEDLNEPLSPITIIDNLMEESISMNSNLQSIKKPSAKEPASLEKVSSLKEPITLSPEKVHALKQPLTLSPENSSSLKEPLILTPEKVSSLKESITLSPDKVSKESLTLLPGKEPHTPEKVSSLQEPFTFTYKEDSNSEEPLILSPVKVLKDPLALDPVKDSILKEPAIIELERVSSLKEPVNIESELCPTSNISSTKSPETVSTCDTESVTSNKDTDSNTKHSISSENTMDAVEKEPSKRIAREMKSLLASAKESKIINECTQLKTKVRKSRTCDSANTSLNNSECDKVSSRRGSTGSHISTCSEKSEKPMKRSMRSQNPDFVSKQKQFLNSVTGKQGELSIDGESGDESKLEKSWEGKNPEHKSPKRKKHAKHVQNMAGLKSDMYCWRCHWCLDAEPIEKGPAHCSVCPRSYHYKCLSSSERNKSSPEEKWACPECATIVAVEDSTNRPLSELLQYAWAAMCEVNGVEPFMSPVDRTAFPHYDDYVVHPMDLSVVKDNILAGLYKSTESFLGDVQWIQHNSIIFNTVHSKLSAAAKALVRSCRLEIGEIEACPECYAGAHARQTTWFTDVCSNPHILLWAKLKGFPYWPAKGMSVNSQGLVNVRFFGAHDRAWVHSKDCFLYSIQDPNGFRTKRPDILHSMEEAELHIRNIAKKFGSFKHADFKTPLDITNVNKQIKEMIPQYENDSKEEVKKNDTSTTLSPGKRKVGDAPIHRLKRRNSSKSATPKIDNNSTVTEDVAPPVAKKKVADENEKSNEHKEKTIANTPTKDRETKEMEEKEEDTKYKESKEEEKKEQGNDDKEIKEQEKKEQETKEKQTKEVTRKRRRSVLEEATLTILESKSTKRKRIGSSENVQIDHAKATSTPIRQKKSKESVNVGDGDMEVEIPKIIVNRTTLKIVKQRSKASNDKADKTPDTSTTTADDSTPKSAKKETPKNVKDVQSWFTLRTKDSGVKLRAKPKPKQYRVSPKINKKENEKGSKKAPENNISGKSIEAPNSKAQEKLQTWNSKKKTVDDDTILSVLARQRPHIQGFPTISDVRSLSSPGSSTSSKDNGPDPTASAKLSTPKSPPIRTEGRVGVRSFARMTSPPKETPNTRPQRGNKDIVVHIKTEPIDAEDQPEKIDFWKSIHLRPTKPAQQVMPTGPPPLKVYKSNGAAGKVVDIAPKAKKSFPLPKKTGEDKDLNRKDSMVYIPVQPPVTNAPIRPAPAKTTPVRINGPISAPVTMPRLTKPVTTTTPTSMNVVNPLPSTLVPLPSPASSSTANSTVSTPTIAPATVRTVPLITTVNGQWTLALQPMMSVGNLDMNPIGPMVNGVANRPLAPATVSPTYVNNIMVNSTCTEPNTLNELPRLQQRPLMNPFDPSTPIGEVPVPSAAGQLTAKINQNAVKLADFFRTLLEDSIEKLDGPAEQVTHLKLQIEQMRWKHQQELQELKHNHELMLLEIRSSIEKDKARIVRETRRACQAEQEFSVSQAKSKQWCANCRQEAQFYCCWNTSYCDYSCQNAHWIKHGPVCTQNKSKKTGSASTVVTVGGKTVARSLNQCPTSQSLLVNMGDDHSNQAVKCLAYTPSSSILINNQMKSTDDTASKVVVSSGYLVVGKTSPNKQTVSLK